MQCSFINIVCKILLSAVDIQCWCTCKHNKINCLVNPWLMQGIIIIKVIWATMESLLDFLYEIQMNHSLLITFYISHTSQTCLWTVSESWRRFSSQFINKLTVCTCSNKFIIIACITVKVAADSEYYCWCRSQLLWCHLVGYQLRVKKSGNRKSTGSLMYSKLFSFK